MKQFTIGKLAEITDVSAETLRYYEKMKLITADGRSASGYRLYSPDAVRVVRFIRGAKELNFTLDEIRQLLALKSSDKATCAEILKHTEAKIKQAESRILELKEIRKVLKQLAKECPADNSPLDCCPILEHINRKSKKLVAAAMIGISTLLAVPQTAEAKPISYVNGFMVMQENDETGHTLSLDYTIDPSLAVGLYAKKESGDMDFTTVGPQVNYLVKRWNFPGAQGNIFSMTGAGVSHWKGDDEFSAWTGILADYETRRIFTSYEIRGMYAGDFEKSVWQRARVGFAPYLANYEDLNTWLMVQVDHHPAKEDNVVVTPLVRFFYKTTLVEAGYSSNNRAMLNWVLQF
ncbi:MAG: heavy metal-responsive transcriptional regulator [Alphaproteobacteria bacterium]|nr:heavy metal-responsive transcriptional regulator [Alphaproteobacteria bacterium]